jgi:hypothetical protein
MDKSEDERRGLGTASLGPVIRYLSLPRLPQVIAST